MAGHTLSVALITEVFADDAGGARLRKRLDSVRREGAELAVLPELPLDRWIPARPEPSAEDAEPAGGPRHLRLAECARAAGIHLLGGAIVRSSRSERRYGTAIMFDPRGEIVGTHRKVHLPDEEGFWEAHHYRPGPRPPEVLDVRGFRLGIQICSDIQRPQGAQLLSAAGAEAILVPRATPAASWERWRIVLRAAAIAGGAYVVSVNRPAGEPGAPRDGDVAIGGPSIVIGPDGAVLAETTDPVAIVELDRRVARRARQSYPGYLSIRADLYAHAWARLEAELGSDTSPD